MSSLLNPIHTAKQKCRPKHQVLVLKCYPKYQKGVQDVKPNSSELSYLLYYASTRRHKLQKVGAFLEKKNAHDVWKGRLGNVQVTLQILAAIIEKSPRDLPLYARSLLIILDSILRSKDVNMVEETIPMFEAFCKHVADPIFTADQNRTQQYLAIVKLYAGFAARDKPTDAKVVTSIPLSIRWRTLGLKAIRAIVASEALNTDSGGQLNTVMPVILDNLSLQQENILAALQQRAKTSERIDDEIARRRRMSIATITTVDTNEGDPATAVETTAGADKVAEEEVRALALRCLKQIFSVGIGSTRGQYRLATALTLKFIASKHPPRLTPETARQGNWATSLFETIARWTPVQDRFIIVVTAMETLVRSPIVEGMLEKQLVLATMIEWLLSSSVNLIGLSVMDVLLGFVQHMLLLLQLGGPNPRLHAHRSTDLAGFFREAKEAFDPSTVLTGDELVRTPSKAELTASPTRLELLQRLESCIAALSNHIYYTDQISDMVAAILSRLKPSAQSDVPTSAAAINDRAAATQAIAEAASIHQDATTSAFFSFNTARLAAAQVVKEILIRANSRRSGTGSAIEARARVGIHIWEGTQWLIKDEDPAVRLAYVDALLTWLKLETNKNDTLLPHDGSKKQSPAKKAGQSQAGGEAQKARRAVSAASRKEPLPKRSSFLALLHLAIYDSILDDPEDESNILSLYLLLTRLVERLGVNALRSGLPMTLRLQEAALTGDASTVGRVNVASVVQAYLWTIADKFNFETTAVGHEINAEVSRRKRFVVWCNHVHFPPLSVDDIREMTASREKLPEYGDEAVETMKPFLSVAALVDEISTSYDNSLLTPPSSPPASPGRMFSVPTLGFGYGYGVTPGPKPSKAEQLPQKIKDEMAAGWSRETCIAAVESESTGSMTGSRTGASSVPKHHLGVNGARKHGSTSGRESPVHANGSTTPNFGLLGGLGGLTKIRNTSGNGSPARVPTTTSSHDSTMRVTDLKRALSTYVAGSRRRSPLRKPQVGSRRSARSSASSSMVSWSDSDDANPSVSDAHHAGSNVNAAVNGVTNSAPPGTAESNRPSSGNGLQGAGPGVGAGAVPVPGTADSRLDVDIPPVPKIPSILNLPGTWPRDVSPGRAETRGKSSSPRRPATATPESKRISNYTYSPSSTRDSKRHGRKGGRPNSRHDGRPLSSSATEKFDVGSLLAGIPARSIIDDGDKENHVSTGLGAGRVIQPPY